MVNPHPRPCKLTSGQGLKALSLYGAFMSTSSPMEPKDYFEPWCLVRSMEVDPKLFLLSNLRAKTEILVRMRKYIQA